MQSIRILTDSMSNFRRFLVDGIEPNKKKISFYLENSLMLVTALTPVIGYDKASKIAHFAHENDLSLKEAALKLGFIDGKDFDKIVDPSKMINPYLAH